jgi:hypothetical protein
MRDGQSDREIAGLDELDAWNRLCDSVPFKTRSAEKFDRNTCCRRSYRGRFSRF